MPEKAYCYMSKCMQRKSAIRSFLTRRKALEYELEVAASNRTKHAQLKRKVDKELKEEQAQIKRLMVAEMMSKARESDLRKKADEARAAQAPRTVAAKKKNEEAKRSGGGSGGCSLPVFELSTKNIPFVIVPQSVKQSMAQLTDCALKMDLRFSYSPLNKQQSRRALVFMSKISSKPVSLNEMYVRLKGDEFLDVEDDVFWFLSYFKRDLQVSSTHGALISECKTYKEDADRIDRWIQRANSRLMS